MRRLVFVAMVILLIPSITTAQMGFGTPGNKSALLWEPYGWVTSGSFNKTVEVLNAFGYDIQYVHQDIAVDDSDSACLANSFCHNHSTLRGVIGMAGHGNEDGMSHEAYAKTPAGQAWRNWRASLLVANGWQSYIVNTVSDDGYGIRVTASKINEFFTNAQTLIYLAGCKSDGWYATAYPDCRVALTYTDNVLVSTMKSDCNSWWGNLGGDGGFDYVHASAARDQIGGTLQCRGNGDTVLVPWQTTFSHQDAVVPREGLMVTFSFKGNTASTGSTTMSSGGLLAFVQNWPDAATCNVMVIPHPTIGGSGSLSLVGVYSANCSDIDASVNSYWLENGVNSAADVSFGVKDDTAIWRVGSEYQTAAYLVEAATTMEGPWQQVGTEHNPGFMEYELDVSTAIAEGKQWFRLVEREESGHLIVHGYAQPSTPSAQSYLPNSPPTLEEAAQRLADHQTARATSSDLPGGLPMNIGDGQSLAIYTIPAFAAAVEQYYASYWRNYGYTVTVETVPGQPQTVTEEDAQIAYLQSRIAANTAAGIKYHELWGRDCDYHYLHGERWASYWTGPWATIHSQMVNRYLSTASDVIIPAPTVRDDLPRGQNLAYWWPYFRSDKAYQVHGAVVTRIPVKELWQVAAYSLVIQEANDWWSYPSYGMGIGLFVGDLDHMATNDGAGVKAAAGQIKTMLLQEGHWLSEIYESEVPNPETRNRVLADQWNGYMGGRTNLNIMYATISGPHYPGNMYSKRELGDNAWNMGLVSPSLNHHPFFLAPTCGTANSWATDDAWYYHTPVVVDMMFDEAGSSGYYGPGGGSIISLNQAIGYQVTQRVIEDFSRPTFESIAMAEEEILALYPDNPMIARQILTMSKLGSALTRIGSVDEVVGVGDNVSRQTALVQNYPNPFNPKTTIQFNLEKPGKITLKVFDVRGSLVATLADENLPAGPQHRVWNGTNDRGQFVASGTYFYRLEADDKSVSRKMLLLK